VLHFGEVLFPFSIGERMILALGDRIPRREKFDRKVRDKGTEQPANAGIGSTVR